nr:MAG TPA: hypothetical protein [Bacteriophage sp.]
MGRNIGYSYYLRHCNWDSDNRNLRFVEAGDEYQHADYQWRNPLFRQKQGRQPRISERRRAMNRTMKQWLLPLICRWFGHKDFEEVYCVKSPRNWFCRQNKPNRYDVVHDIVCSRCWRVHRTILKSRISRAQLLHDGWFIIDE